MKTKEIYVLEKDGYLSIKWIKPCKYFSLIVKNNHKFIKGGK